MDPSRRAHARYPCDIPAELHTGPTGGVRLADARLMDLSLTGCLFATTEGLRPGATYRLTLVEGGVNLDLPGRVARNAGRSEKSRFYGFVFNLTAGQEKVLRTLLDRLRRAPERPGEDRLSRSMRDYWSS